MTGGGSVGNLHQLVLPVLHAPGTFLGYPDFFSWLHDWAPIILMAVLVLAIFSLMRFMPRTNPHKIKPDAAPQIGWSDIAGSDEAQGEPSPRPARDRKDPAGQGGRPRVGSELLLPVSGLVCRDVRRRRRGTHPAPVSRGSQ